ncbi:adhesion G protein-coupled receptor E3-like isoform X2 [Trichosurus vulpecula]|uniref:adhesion G protein-coupled receptor E3-like isoform X2 n=1 Tax=Trichosurus vulpecula TaxID=9337 RepID=UPI00186B0F0D|nr:adhesion G protein-coupled receptor E3-like isoform X2 [Trichosurus vulpecula]
MAESWFLLLWGLFILLATATVQKQEDINQCNTPNICGKNEICIDRGGSYICSCYSTYYAIHAFFSFFKSCPVKDTSSSGGSNQEMVPQISENISNIFNDIQSSGNKSIIALSATIILQEMETVVLNGALNPNDGVQAPDEFVVTDTRVVPDNNCSERIFTLKAGEDAMAIHCTEVIRGRPKGQSAVAFLSYSTLGHIINGSFFEEERHLRKADNISLNSRVVSGTVGHRQNSSLTSSAILTFQHLRESYSLGQQYTLCVYWKSTEEGAGWSTEGCSLLKTNDTHTSCSCNHLSTFAVLMALTGPVLCSTIAVGLHYLYLAAFTWMFLEGLHLFLTVRNLKVANYTNAGRFKKRFMYPFGYGIPAVIVAVSAGIDPQGYGTVKHCWLTVQRGFIWSFVGPVITIILFNLVFYLIILWILRDRLSSLNKDVSTIQNTRTLTFKALAQFFILGCSWSLSFLLTESIREPARSVIAYTFTIINSLQGLYIFLVHCILNRQVREEYRKWFKGIQKMTETDSSDILSGPTTHSKVTDELEKSQEFSEKRKKNLSSEPEDTQ